MYTYFKKDKKVLCVIQIVDDSKAAKNELTPVMPHPAGAGLTTMTGGDNAPEYFYDGTEGTPSYVIYNDIDNDSVPDNNTTGG